MKTYNAIIVLGGGIDMDGNLRGPSKCRIQKTLEFWKAAPFKPPIIVSSKYSMNLQNAPKATIAEAMQAELIKSGISKENIILENESRDTIGNAYFTRKTILEPKCWRYIAVVTSHFHRQRSKVIFKKILGPKYQVTFIEAGNGLSKDDLQKQLILEKKQLELTKIFFENLEDGNLDEIESRLFKDHPAYAKDANISIEDFFGDMKSPFHEENPA